jgi:hypothetical protein
MLLLLWLMTGRAGAMSSGDAIGKCVGRDVGQ